MESDPTSVTVEGLLTLCPTCRAPAIITNGVPTQPITVWTHDGATRLTPHTADCEMRGRPVPIDPLTNRPVNPFAVGPFRTEPT
jgi:hypothetical protein